MKTIITTVLLALTIQANAQVYVPGGAPLCFPQTYMTPTGPVTVVICQ